MKNVQNDIVLSMKKENREVSKLGRPSYGSRRCPNNPDCHRGYDSFERLYVRRGTKWIPVGRKCKQCQHIVLDPFVTE